MNRMKIVFFGTPEFAVASLKAILDNGYKVAAVVTTPDRTGGRGGNKLIISDVKKFAEERNLPVLQPEKLRSEEFINTLKQLQPDLFIVIAFRMLPEVVWRIPRLGTFNLHASLLPQLRGAAPINHAIISGFKKTGVTTFFINEEIDKGEILLSAETCISDDDDAESLHDRLMHLGADLVIETIRGLENETLHPSPQPQSDLFTPAPKIFKPDCKIDFANHATTVDRFIRGLSPYPGAWSNLILDDGREIEVKILKVRPVLEKSEYEPGICVIKNKSLLISTSEGFLEVLKIQPSGKTPMEGKAFLAGYRPVKLI